MDKLHIKGKVSYKNLETGFWGIVDEDNKKWRAVDMPESLRKDGITVELTAEKVAEDFSVIMWGKPIKILNFKIIQ